MQQKPMIMSRRNMVAQTLFSKSRAKSLVDQARLIQEDPKKNERIDASKCVVCYYLTRVGGAAMTYRECMCCTNNMLYSSTATDVLCTECAVKYGLCKCCGGDLELNVNRLHWPENNE